MTTTSLTALYDTRADAERAAERLVGEAGVDRSDIGVIAQPNSAAGTPKAADTGFFASLKNLFGSDDDHAGYSEAIRRGGLVLTARVELAHAERAVAILEEHGAVDLDQRQQAWRAEGWAGQAASAAVAPPAVGSGPSEANLAPAAEERIQLGEEQLRVGKRIAATGRVRVRSFVVETPVEEAVTLRHEHVSVEQRKVDRAPTAAETQLFADRTIEAQETAEEAVVAKTARVIGEVLVNTTVGERVETVHDTVRRTEVEVLDERSPKGAGERPVNTTPSGPDQAGRP